MRKLLGCRCSAAELKFDGRLDAVEEVWQLADQKKVQSKSIQFRGTRIVSQKPIFYFSLLLGTTLPSHQSKQNHLYQLRLKKISEMVRGYR
jgi:hypothetical protein